MKIRWMIFAACFGFAGLLATASAHAESCAWLNAATAGGLLGAESAVSIAPMTEHLTPNQTSARQISGARPDAVCTFVPLQTGSGAKLEIAVHTMANVSAEFAEYEAACGKDSIALRAVGNQAMECSVSDEKHRRVEKVIARTRDRAFLLSWTVPESSGMTQEVIREKMRNLAEQVAGSLF
ncbi:MAG TPA: hypothetical protein VIM62_13230 [Acidobacteriaceae bacterium]